MIQQLAHDTGAHVWAIASMLFFIGVFALVVVRVFRTPRVELLRNARLPLDGDDGDDGNGDDDAQHDAASREVCDG